MSMNSVCFITIKTKIHLKTRLSVPAKRKVAFKKEVKIKNITVFQNYHLYYLNNKSHRFPFLQSCLDFQDLLVILT